MSLDAIREILIELGLDPEDVTSGAHLDSDLGLDSTEIVEIALEVRRRLGVEVKLEAERDYTVAEVADLVQMATTR